MEIMPIFPKLVAITNINRDLTSSEKKVIETEYKNNKTNNTSNHIGQDKYVLDNPKLKSIKKFIEEQIAVYVKTGLCHDVEYYITISWLNFTSKNQSHHKHTHSNSILSGVFYVDVIDGVDSITFSDSSYNRIEIIPTESNNLNAKEWTFPVKNGDLFLFDSSISHEVKTNKEEHLRTSIAFNTFVRGEFGKYGKATYLKI